MNKLVKVLLSAFMSFSMFSVNVWAEDETEETVNTDEAVSDEEETIHEDTEAPTVLDDELIETEPEEIELATETEGYYTYTISDGEATITKCDKNVSGDVTIPANLGGYPVTCIGKYAFESCVNITSVSIPEGVISIGKDAFKRCTSLNSIEIPDSVTSIGAGAFLTCSSLASVVIPYGISRIEPCTFEECSSLVSITIPNTVTFIGASAFISCTSLPSVEIPHSVTTICCGAFENCTNLTSVSLSARWNSIDEYSSDSWSPFRGCSKLTEITIPKGMYKMPNAAFKNCTSLKKVNFNDELAIITYDSFYGCTSLTNIIIPNSVTTVDSSAFYGCTSLTNIIIPNSVTSIGSYSFYGCTGLNKITISNKTVYIGESAFEGCIGLISVEIPDSVNTISRDSFKDCTNLSSVSLSIGWDSTSIAGYGVESPFRGCTNLTEITIPKGMSAIPKAAFKDCTFIKSVNFSEGLTTIGDDAFYGCTGLIGIKIPNSVKRIGNYSFYGCIGFTSVTLSNTVTKIGEYAFYGIPDLTICGVLGSFAEQYANDNGITFKECTDHVWDLKTIVKSATCTEKGIKEYICLLCGKSKTESIDIVEHDYSATWTLDVKSTCLTDGSESRHCTRCDSTTDVRTIEATGHTEVTTPAVSASCLKTGLTAGKKCSVCGTVTLAQKTVAKTAHTYNIYGRCSKCGTYASGISTKVPSMKVKSISKAKGALTVKWAKNTKVKGYQIRYSLKPTMTSAKTVNISKNKTTSKKISKLLKKTKYYVQIRAYALVNGKTMYSPWSAVKSQTTK